MTYFKAVVVIFLLLALAICHDVMLLPFWLIVCKPCFPQIISFVFLWSQTENGLVEAVAVLVSTMPRLRPTLPTGKLGQCCKTRPDFVKVCLIK
jgi:hypothetical protein